VSDTSYEGYMEIPRYVMQGYTVMADEALRQLAAEPLPTHILIPGGVGGFAAAVAAQVWETLGAERPRMIVVEPDRAACIYETAKAGKPVPVQGALDTIMAGLACGEVSLLAWEVLEEGCDDFLTVPDEAAADCMRLLAEGKEGDSPIVAGESAVAGLAGLLLALENPEIADALDLGPQSRVLLFGSEGATDVEVYTRIVGRRPEEVLAA
jgi:diaminopropionate ammonia-lyase